MCTFEYLRGEARIYLTKANLALSKNVKDK